MNQVISPFVAEGFSLMTPSVFDRYPDKVPPAPGVYAILLRNGLTILRRCGYDVRHQPWKIRDFDHLYTGETWNLRARLTEHLDGEAERSGLRYTLLALQVYTGAVLFDGVEASIEDHDLRLRRLLRADALIAFKRSDLVGDVEENLIARSGSPLNIRGQKKTGDFKRLLKESRASLRAASQSQTPPNMSGVLLRAPLSDLSSLGL